MKISDILGMSLANLWRRKTRTLLTILGVLIGTTSIVVMLSLGIGLKSAMMEEVGTSGGLTQINVYMDYYYGDSSSAEMLLLDDSAIENFLSLPYVESVEPQLEFSFPIQTGKYEQYAVVYGISNDKLSQINLGEGEMPTGTSKNLELIAGNQIKTDFYDRSTGRYPYWEDEEVPNIDLINGSLIAGIESYNRYEQNDESNSSSSENEIFDPVFSENAGETTDPNAIPQDNVSLDTSEETTNDYEGAEYSYSSFNANMKRVPIKVTGITAGDLNSYTEYSYGYYTSIDQLKKFLKDNYSENDVIPGQPTDKNGKPYRDLKYSSLVVDVDNSENVEEVLQTIQDMGYHASANKEWLEEVEKTFMIVEAVLGGIGGVAMLVAAISIANTMTMSTYERTKEIGIMKVLGCSLSNIRAMFLTEAAYIGFFGGLIGLLLSMILSAVVNNLMSLMQGLDLPPGAKISVIPVWLFLLALGFSTIIGMVAGFVPAQRATKLSPLNAIRNE